MQPSRTELFQRFDVRFAASVLIAGLLIATWYHSLLWTLDDRGFSLLSKRLPYWDFTNLWAGSRMALDGHVADLFDVETYRAALRSMFSPDLPDQEWSYPPSIILLGAPLAALPILPAYLVWTFGTVFCLWLATRPLKLGPAAELAIILSPAVFMNAVFGQNGALTTALLVGGLAVAPRRPLLAGVLFGLLTIKPHLGLLVPFCLVASGNWRTVWAAAASATVLAVATGLLFGFEVWPHFFKETRALMTAIMEAPFPQPYHSNAMTVFFLARARGFGLGVSYGLQAISTVTAIAAAVWLWLPQRRAEHRERVVITALLAILATPYGYTYDTICVAIAAVFLFVTAPKAPAIVLACFWFYALVAHVFNNSGLGIGVFVPATLAVWMLVSIRQRERRELFAPTRA
ncbi:glycosyltransferase family 87 protein [Mesorhizobium sp. KR1-2]|uniref:glycosyltransferase family 87 protein n=1 Tax=Mesorhizobium sp. KR1-2 TaxID=3156609 RepID=UPI0032B359BC